MSALVLVGIFIVLIVLCVIIATRGESSSVQAQRRHDEEYRKVENVYVVLQTNNYVTENHIYDNRHVTVIPAPEVMPLLSDRKREIEQQQQGRRFKIVGETEEWYDDEQEPTVGTGSTEREPGQYRYLPRRRQAYRLPG